MPWIFNKQVEIKVNQKNAKTILLNVSKSVGHVKIVMEIYSNVLVIKITKNSSYGRPNLLFCILYNIQISLFLYETF